MSEIGKKHTWLHILFWGILWALLPYVFFGFENSMRSVVRSGVTFGLIAALVLGNMEWLLPRYYFQKKIGAYVLGAIGLLALISFLQEWDFMPWADHFNPPEHIQQRIQQKGSPKSIGMRYIGRIVPFLTTLLGSSLFEVARYANQKEKEAIGLRNEKLETEMKFLKSQINPHFLFNALNNIYTLSVLKSDDAPEHLLKLSGMLRYMLYDCNAERVLLSKEIEYLKNYIDLYKLKDSRGLNIRVDLDESRPGLVVAPLLFIPFIENAFKHSQIEDLDKGWIEIGLQTRDTGIDFKVSNSVPDRSFTKDASGGIGLSNVQRQLELLYPEKHELHISNRPTQYDVSLKIDLQ